MFSDLINLASKSAKDAIEGAIGGAKDVIEGGIGVAKDIDDAGTGLIQAGVSEVNRGANILNDCLGGDTYMTSAKFLGFETPSPPPLVHIWIRC